MGFKWSSGAFSSRFFLKDADEKKPRAEVTTQKANGKRWFGTSATIGASI
jgi:hypothetical protein